MIREATAEPLRKWVNNPRQLFFRRILFWMHLSAGLGLNIYVFAISLSGAALVFLDEAERIVYKDVFSATNALQPQADLSLVIKEVRSAYSGYRLVSLYPPTPKQPFYAYLVKGDSYAGVFLDSATGKIIREIAPDGSAIRALQNLHFNLLGGPQGRVINGVGALLMLGMCTTGIVIWWPGARNWKRSMKVDPTRGWKRINWDIHSATGFWAVSALAMWAITGASFAFPRQFVSMVRSVSVPTFNGPPLSHPAPGKVHPLDVHVFAAKAQALRPQAKFSGIVLPANVRAPFLVFMARTTSGDIEHADYLYFDQFTGELLKTYQRGVPHTLGDRIMGSMVPLHFGTFGGLPIKTIWFLIGLAPAVLSVSGFLMWWNRVLRKKWEHMKSLSAAGPRPTENELQTPLARSIGPTTGI